MKILLDYEVSADEFDDLMEDFEWLEFIETPTIEWSVYTQVVIDSKEILLKEFDDWLEWYIKWWARLELDTFKTKYILTY